ncbi:MAG: hypothetical protein H7288_22620 [Kineosporiaceae bacterium]|nr:hypothetical protein [Aeromicrobium sp.]
MTTGLGATGLGTTGSGVRPAYLPILALPHWGVIGAFVDAAVAASLAGTGRSERDLYAAATPMVLWAWRARGIELENQTVFRRSIVEQFIHLGMPGAAPGSQATLRSTLWRMTEILNPDDIHEKHRPIGRRNPTAPYSESEIAELYSWANTQRTPGRSRNALILLVLGLGTGLATRELLEVRHSDVSLGHTLSGAPAASIVTWSDRPRVVPVRPEWTRTLHSVLADTPCAAYAGNADAGFSGGSDRWLFRPGRTGTSDGQVTDFLTRARTHVDVRPSRMRTTWLLLHLKENLPAAELLRISGLRNYAALDILTPLLPFAPDLENI